MARYAASEAFLTVAQVRAQDNCGCVDDADPPDAILEALIDQASDIIAISSGMVVTGRRSITARPCRTGYPDWCECGCGLDGIPLGDRNPVVTSVKINGATIPSNEYALHATRIGYHLVRVSTSQTRPADWPSSQKMWLADTEDNTFSVTFTEGINVDQFVITQAAMELVCDMVSEDLTNINELEEGVISADLGGVTVQVDPDRLERFRQGSFGPANTRLMGIYAAGGRHRSQVWAPELLSGWTLNANVAVV